ncbi:MAG: hypothetical protein K8T26_06520 [Lentisphaerae bacterium]|nr:hypothetical protein [Lentisphaerota bacterium]
MTERAWCAGPSLRRWCAGGAIAVLLGHLAGAAADTPATPVAESFERYASGTAITAVPGWSHTSDAGVDAGRVTNAPDALDALTNYAAGGGTFPLLTTHSNALALGGTLALSLASPAGEPVRTDMLLLPFLADERPAFDDSCQLALLFNALGHAEIFHLNVTAAQSEWITLTNAPAVTTQTWTRVTFLQDYQNHLFQVRLNDSEPIVDDRGWDGPPATGAHPGPWFPMPNTNGAMGKLAFQGEGAAYLDDLVVGGLLPRVDTLTATNVTAGAADLNGFLSTTGFAATAVQAFWGPSDGGTNATAWEASAALPAPQQPGTLRVSVSGLDSNRTYACRFAASNAFGLRWAEASSTFTPGVVSIAAVDATAQESPQETGTLLITRPGGATNLPLTVLYALGGTATNGEDYLALPGAVTIPAGATSATVTIAPRRDALTEGQETVEASLLAGPYALASPGPAAIYIQDSPPGSVNLTWNNGAGTRVWNANAPNWIGGDNFLDGDYVAFSGIATGRIYVGTATLTGAGFTDDVPVPVFPAGMTVDGGRYEFEGGAIAGGQTRVDAGGVLVDRNLESSGLGSGRLTLNGGQFWRQVPPGTTVRTQTFTNDILVAAESLLNGNRGDNYWHGTLELKDRLLVNDSGAGSVAFHHWFCGRLIVNQDTNAPHARSLHIQGQDGVVRISGDIVDDPDPAHNGRFPLVLGSQKLSDTVAADEIYVDGTNNTYSTGTVIAYPPTAGNNLHGVTVAPGARLGFGPVVVQGLGVDTGARLTLSGTRAVRDTVTVEDGATLVINAPDAIDNDAGLIVAAAGKVVLASGSLVETVHALTIGGTNAGDGYFDRHDYPQNIVGDGQLYVRPRRVDGLLLLIR